jgi:hypothetical protein
LFSARFNFTLITIQIGKSLLKHEILLVLTNTLFQRVPKICGQKDSWFVSSYIP